MYHSPYAPHVMTIPTLAWNPGVDGGEFETHAAGSIGGDEMIEAMIDKMKVFFAAAVTFDSFSIFTKTAVDAPAIPRYAKALAVVGTNATPGNYKMVQSVWTAKCVNGSLAKINFMDVGNNNSFEKVTFATIGAGGTAFLDEWFASTNAWSSRQDSQPYFFLQASYGINDKLKREYHEN